MGSDKILVSITAHEKINVLQGQIRNIKEFLPCALIIVHINESFRSAILSSEYLAHQLAKLAGEDCVLVNPSSMRTKWGHMFHAHISNFAFAEAACLSYSHALLLSSGDLFFRYGASGYIQEHNAGVGQEPISNEWIWSKFVMEDEVVSRILKISEIDRPVMSLHEGTFYRRELISKFLILLTDLVPDWEYDDRYPKEEVFFPSLLPSEKVRPGRPIALHLPFNHPLGKKQLSYILSQPNLNLQGASMLLDEWLAENAELDNPRFASLFVVSRVARRESSFLRMILSNANEVERNAAARYIASKADVADLVSLDGQARDYERPSPFSLVTQRNLAVGRGQ